MILQRKGKCKLKNVHMGFFEIEKTEHNFAV